MGGHGWCRRLLVARAGQAQGDVMSGWDWHARAAAPRARPRGAPGQRVRNGQKQVKRVCGYSISTRSGRDNVRRSLVYCWSLGHAQLASWGGATLRPRHPPPRESYQPLGGSDPPPRKFGQTLGGGNLRGVRRHLFICIDSGGAARKKRRFLPKTRSKQTFWLFLLISTLHSGLPPLKTTGFTLT